MDDGTRSVSRLNPSVLTLPYVFGEHFLVPGTHIWHDHYDQQRRRIGYQERDEGLRYER
jgi:hypothetical protein